MKLIVTPTLDEVVQKLGDFIAWILSTDEVVIPVIQLPVNRAAPPLPDPGFVGMRPAVLGRISTNIDMWDQTILDPTTLQILQSIKFSVQLDCYSPQASEWALILSTVLRDEYAVRPLKPILAPLYTDDPVQAPLIDGEEQYEKRWIVQTYLQYNPIVTVPQEFANRATVGVVNVDVRYPP